MSLFRKRPVVVEAFRYRLDAAPDWFADAVMAGTVEIHATSCTIKTLEGVVNCDGGHWIIRGVAGELYPCRPDIFAAIYEPVRP